MSDMQNGTFWLAVVILIFQIYKFVLDMKYKARTTTKSVSEVRKQLIEDKDSIDDMFNTYSEEIKGQTKILNENVTSFKIFAAEQSVVNQVASKALDSIVKRLEVHENMLFSLVEKIGNLKLNRGS